MNNKKPIKRSDQLKPLSRDHHYSLLLCWKIRTGIKKGTEAERIKAYADWFYNTHILPHFEAEEKYAFPILGNENELVKKAIAEHRRLKQLFNSNTDLQKQLVIIAEELESHIRFEERILFNEIQEKATPDQLQSLLQIHSGHKFTDNLNDPFWEY